MQVNSPPIASLRTYAQSKVKDSSLQFGQQTVSGQDQEVETGKTTGTSAASFIDKLPKPFGTAIRLLIASIVLPVLAGFLGLLFKQSSEKYRQHSMDGIASALDKASKV